MLANFAKVHLGGVKNMYRIAICDDDLVFGSLLEQYLQNFAKTRRIPIDVLVFARGEEYLEFLIEELPVDLIFLDIQFEKGLDGVQIGKELRADIKNEMTQIIYISGIESYSFDGVVYKSSNSKFKTRKRDDVKHGYGLQSVERVVKKYSGIMRITHDEHLFCVDLYFYV